MARKKSIGINYLAAFALGVIVGIAIFYSVSYSTYLYQPGTYMGPYMMPMMQRMTNYQYSGTGDCTKYTEAQLEEFGDTLMIQMMGQQFEEQMDARLSEETSRLMHLMMGRMYLGC